jgi:hypothetical protein
MTVNLCWRWFVWRHPLREFSTILLVGLFSEPICPFTPPHPVVGVKNGRTGFALKAISQGLSVRIPITD